MKNLFSFLHTKIIFFIFLSVLLPACTTITEENKCEFRNQILTIAEKRNFSKKSLQTRFFQLTTFSHITQVNNPNLIIYLEGDGQSYNSKYQLSLDPTPYRPLSLQLALADGRSNIVYIARPGQYPLTSENCDPKYWSTHRFSTEVIQATNEAINYFKTQIAHPFPQIELIGFSGGGGLAVLLAAHRNDVKRIVTIAADLDIASMSSYHKTKPLKNSLNPIDFAPTLNHTPQYHFVGKKDRIVPCEIAKKYVQQSQSPLVQMQLIQADHQNGWLEKWPSLLLYFS